MKRGINMFLTCLMLMLICSCDLDNNETVITTVTETIPTISATSVTTETTGQTMEIPERVLIFCNLPIPELDSLFENGGRNVDEVPQEGRDPLLDKLRKRYDVDYNVYSKGNFLGIRTGIVRGDWQLEYFFDIDLGIDYNGEYEDIYIAIDTDHELIPAKLTYDDTKTVSDSVMKEIKDRYSLADLNVEERIDVDLDGDGKDEAIVTVSHPEEYFSANILLSNDDKIASYMQVCVIEEYFQRDDPYQNPYLTKFHGEIADTDGDGIMEIYMIYLAYEGFEYEEFTYDKGVFSGEFVNMSPINP